MTESERLVNLFTDLYNGDPWLDVTLVATLSNITAEQAQKRVLTNCNSIWEITNHLISYRINVLKRIQGEIMTTPANNYFETIQDTSEEAWKDTLVTLAETQRQWIIFLKRITEDIFENVYPVNQMTYYEHIQGIIQHDAYHLGQIVLLNKNV